MQANKKQQTVTSAARRQQIVDAAVTVLARDGLSQTSLGRIATEAGLSSTGLITYHFADKDEVLITVVDHLISRCTGALRTAVDSAAGPADALAAYIEAFVRFQDDNRDGVRALWRLAAGWKAPGRAFAFDDEPLVAPVRGVLDDGQRGGAFRDLDSSVVAQSIVCAVEGFHELFTADPDIDTTAFIRELQVLYRRGTEYDGRG
ncbi:TetR/AcrR family transcriptional regulator [Polymorphospora rubra]|uniref:TetR/AcrR family transcriptional regulator n=1 Tax=Polymorphospora rubra TaxID=338584 RepID=UPI001BB35EED|nr:TetR/AcrR family transcriptional regulator [Polymorphospora rubra]